MGKITIHCLVEDLPIVRDLMTVAELPFNYTADGVSIWCEDHAGNLVIIRDCSGIVDKPVYPSDIVDTSNYVDAFQEAVELMGKELISWSDGCKFTAIYDADGNELYENDIVIYKRRPFRVICKAGEWILRCDQYDLQIGLERVHSGLLHKVYNAIVDCRKIAMSKRTFCDAFTDEEFKMPIVYDALTNVMYVKSTNGSLSPIYDESGNLCKYRGDGRNEDKIHSKSS